MHHLLFVVVAASDHQEVYSGSVAEDQDSLEAGHQSHGAVILGAVEKAALAIIADAAECHGSLAGASAVAVAKVAAAVVVAAVVAVAIDVDVVVAIAVVVALAPLAGNMLH